MKFTGKTPGKQVKPRSGDEKGESSSVELRKWFLSRKGKKRTENLPNEADFLVSLRKLKGKKTGRERMRGSHAACRDN